MGLAMHSELVDRLTARMSGELSARGIGHILLKGPSLARWLYPPDEIRTYGDSDLLVQAAQWDATTAVLRENGFQDAMAAMAHPRMESLSSHPWESPDGDVDLHATLDGLTASPPEVWAALSTGTETMSIGGREVTVLSPTARLMHVALHARSLQSQALRDLELALERFGDSDWAEAAGLAERLGGTAAFAAGLRARESGLALAERLDVAGVSSVETELQEGGVPLAAGLHALAQAKGVRRRLAVAGREIVPTPEFIRFWSPRLARRGAAGMALAYAWRPLWLVSKLPAAIRELRRARQDANRRS